uniref:Uncharacterized protein n=1 Tax=Macrostomum lignano TaxID=282301 RepID=A0A1I8FPB8_9PLAT
MSAEDSQASGSSLTPRNFDEYMKALGRTAPAVPLQAGAGDQRGWRPLDHQTTTSPPSRAPRSASRLGEEFEETTADGRKVKSTVAVWRGNKLIQEQKATRTPPSFGSSLPTAKASSGKSKVA